MHRCLPSTFCHSPADPIYSGDVLLLAAVGWTDAESQKFELTYQFFYTEPSTAGPTTPIALNPTPMTVPVMSVTAPYLGVAWEAQEIAYSLRVCDGDGGCAEKQFPITVTGTPVTDTAVATSQAALTDTIASTSTQTTNEPIPSGVPVCLVRWRWVCWGWNV